MKNKSSTEFVFFLILLNVIVSGGNSPLIKIALREIPSFTFNFLRFFIAFVFFIPLLLNKKIKIGKHLNQVLMLSLLLTLNIVLFNFGIQKTTATAGQMLYSSVPIITGIGSYFFLREKFNRKKLLGITIGFIGTLLIVFLPLIERKSIFGGDLIGNTIIFIAAIFTSAYFIFSKKLQKNYSPTDLTFYFILVTVISQLVFTAVEAHTHQGWWLQLSREALFGLIYVGSVGTVGLYFLFQFIISKSTPLVASMSLYLLPVSTFIWSIILLKENLTFGFIIGALLTFIGVWLTTTSEEAEELSAELQIEEFKV